MHLRNLKEGLKYKNLGDSIVRKLVSKFPGFPGCMGTLLDVYRTSDTTSVTVSVSLIQMKLNDCSEST